MKCGLCGLEITGKEDKEFAENQEAHPGFLGPCHKRCYEKLCEEAPQTPWEDPISGEVDWKAMEEDLGVETWEEEYDDIW